LSRHKESQRRATAYHEAGHLAAAWRLGIKIRRATIIPTTDCTGEVEHDNPLRGIHLDVDGSDRARLRAEKLIILALAGPEAQRRFNPRSWRAYHGAADHQQAVDIALSLNASEEAAAAHLKWLEVRARDLIVASWDVVEVIAAELLNQGVLSSAHVDAAIVRAGFAEPSVR
jgi:hypothetical protein